MDTICLQHPLCALTVAGYWGAPAKPPELMSETKPRRSALEPLSAGGNDSGGSVSVGGTIGTLRGRFGESSLALHRVNHIIGTKLLLT